MWTLRRCPGFTTLFSGSFLSGKHYLFNYLLRPGGCSCEPPRYLISQSASFRLGGFFGSALGRFSEQRVFYYSPSKNFLRIGVTPGVSQLSQCFRRMESLTMFALAASLLSESLWVHPSMTHPRLNTSQKHLTISTFSTFAHASSPGPTSSSLLSSTTSVPHIPTF